ncbi:hypothetical protein AJ79_06425 [Helicocarpus griseus UAMH5409]|uniref:RNA polymerase I-specific transcription initiation factor rrn11 n=1 Tax=Helicocarpus griseus UAMH5409 TaxID=1447875 RepID=A0A2B7X554_9EURO|nr:hypothetical protein AJ79_06425 [Helicocarpus griseus UAMH5409]
MSSSQQSSTYFSFPLASWQQPLSFRTARYEPRKRRRKHNELGEVVEEDGISGASASDGNASTTSNDEGTDGPKSSLILTPDEAHQYRVAGQPFHRKLPGGGFPHAKPKSGKAGKVTRKDIETELSQLSPPIFVPEPANQGSLRLQHLAVITAILHRCILEGDYTRAGRAWGLILRDEFRGHSVDIRTGGRWGIGAEILLWSDGNEDGSNLPPRRRWFTRKGFERAKSYYERLVLQYPYRKSAPRALGPLDFYPAMFGLWISLVQEESQAARETVMDLEEMDDSHSAQDNMSISSDVPPRKNNQKDGAVAETRRKELEEAQQIAAQMDELLISPPFSDSYELLRLRGMVSLWIADLYVSSVSLEDGDTSMGGFGGDQTMMSDEDGQMDSVLARVEHGLSMERKVAEVERANGFFKKAKTKAGRKQTPLPSDETDEDDSVI